jgi:hypothetical protein
MRTIIAILVLALTTSLLQAASSKKRSKANVEISSDAKKKAPRHGAGCRPALILGIAY